MNEVGYTEAAKESGIPMHMIEELVQYILVGRPLGGFLYALLSNDLERAMRKADPINSGRLQNYLNFLDSYAPAACWGSQEKVSKWLGEKK